jgi:type I restriction enzyme M protein
VFLSKCNLNVKTAFRSSKVFEYGGHFLNLLNKSAKEAKTDERLKNSGKLVQFVFYNQKWPLEPKTAFYD